MNFFHSTFFAHHTPIESPGNGPRPGILVTLADSAVGSQVRVIGFLPGLAADRQTQLQSYGLAPGRTVQVLQHSPVTVLQIEQFEMALEREMAAYVEVTQNLAD